MRTLSDLTNEQLMELIEEIKKKNGGETDAKNWSHEDIERLLDLTNRGRQLEELDREVEADRGEQTAEENKAVAEEEKPEIPEPVAESKFKFVEEPSEKSIEDELDDDEFEAESLENAVKFLSEEKTDDNENVKAFDIAKEHESTDGDERLKSIMNDVAPAKKEKKLGSAKKGFSSLAQKIKNSGEKFKKT